MALPVQKDGILGWLVNGWQLSASCSRPRSGQALDITASGALLRAPGNTQRPT